MKINEILKKCSINFKTENVKNFDVKGISFNSKEIKENFIFGAVIGSEDNGEKYLNDLKKLRHIGIIVRDNFKVKEEYNNFFIIKTKKVKELTGEIASLIYPNSIKEKIAITGTNGKTSIAHYIAEISSRQKVANCTFGTLGIIFNNKQLSKTNLTTNNSVINHKFLNILSEKKCKRVIFEASSIGLDQKRLQNIKFDKIAITNLTVDHLDYHGKHEKYRYCKSLLLREHSNKKTIVVLNSDIKELDYFKRISQKNRLCILDYGKKAKFLKILRLEKISEGFKVSFLIKKKILEVNFNCITIYQVYNQICALLLVFGEKFINGITKSINLSDPVGRLEKIYDNDNKKIFIDYAHTPDALKNVLSNLSERKKGRLIIVFGCGGDRDPSKRSLMTNEALKYCNKIYLTSDNPRNEDQKEIFKDMKRGILDSKLTNTFEIEDRRKAINKAIDELRSGDILIIAGKGHENYQIFKNKVIPFSDKRVVIDKLG